VGGDGVGAVRVGVRIHRRHGCWLGAGCGGAEGEGNGKGKGFGGVGLWGGVWPFGSGFGRAVESLRAFATRLDGSLLRSQSQVTQERYATCIALLQRVINEMLSRKKKGVINGIQNS
jgi:hypothetical protein